MLVRVIVLVIGFFIIMPLLTFVSTSVLTWRKSAEQELAYYAADAGIEAVLSDLRQGEDALSPSYSVPSVTLNYYTATVTVEEPPRPDALPFGPVFVDPGTTTSLYPLGSKAEFLYELDNVRGGSPIQVNWVFTPADSNWQIKVYEGSGVLGEQVGNETGSNSPGRIIVDPVKIKGGIYTIYFYNNSPVPTYSTEFSTIGDGQKTWLRVSAFKDYVITSTAGPVTITVFARQGPGPNPAASSLGIMTWHAPY